MDTQAVLKMNDKLIAALNTQNTQHAKQIAGLAEKVEHNTKVVQECIQDLVVLSSERVNLTRCLADMKNATASHNERLISLEIACAIRNTRLSALKYGAFLILTLAAAGGGVAAWLKFL